MLIDQICELRDKLNKSILTEDYEVTYELSIRLDELITKYYNQLRKHQHLFEHIGELLPKISEMVLKLFAYGSSQSQRIFWPLF